MIGNATKEVLKMSISYLLTPFDLLHRRSKKNNVAMIHLGRSGSTVLGDLLNQHSKVKWAGEIYGKHIKRAPEDFYRMLQEKHDVYKILETKRRGTIKQIYGYELKFYHLHFLGATLTEYINASKEMGIQKFIVLERLNYLRVIISSLVALKNGVWHSKKEKNKALTMIRINVSNLKTDGESKSLMEFLDSYTESFKNAKTILKDSDMLHLCYEEDILNKPNVAYAKTCEFLGIAPEAPQIHYWKTNDYSLKDVITNFKEVKEYLNGSQYEWMLDDE